METAEIRKRVNGKGQFEGKFLLAMPDMDSEEFSGTVIYICAHSDEGAMGFVLNRTSTLTLAELIGQTELGDNDAIRLAPEVYAAAPVRSGGPVDSHRGFVLHSDDYCSDSTIPISQQVYLTSTIQILRSIACGRGPRKLAVSLGYSGWGPGQLEREIAENSWLTLDAQPEMIFDIALETKYDRLLQHMGINMAHFISEAGNA